jgi:hypothetical protein
MGMKGLGRLFDLSCGVAPVDLAGGAQTGKVVALENAGGVTVVFFKEAGAAAEPVVLTVRESQDAAGTGIQDLDVVTEYYLKSEATLDGDEVWSKVTQTAGDITPAASDTQQILAFYIDADQLSDTYTHVQVNTADVTTAGQIGGILYILHDLKVQRAPANLAAPQ